MLDEVAGATVIDFGVETVGSLGAGLALAEVCTAGLAEISICPGDIDGRGRCRSAGIGSLGLAKLSEPVSCIDHHHLRLDRTKPGID